jgi:hypothetical protein
VLDVTGAKISPTDYVKAWQKRHDGERKPYADALGRHALQLGVIDAAGRDTQTVVGLARYLVLRLKVPGELDFIKELGAAETGWFHPLPPPPSSEKLTLLLEEEPGRALAECLARDGFVRVTTDPEARPIVAMGRGSFKGYQAVLEGNDRVQRGGPPGGILRGTPFTSTRPGDDVPTEPEALVPPHGAEPAPVPGAPAPKVILADGSAEVAPARALLGARPYREAEIERVADDQPLHKLPRERWKQMAAEVACQEGPADATRIATRIGELCGQSCVRGQTIDKLAACLLEHTKGHEPLLVRTEGRFFHAAGNPVRARDRSGCDARLRAVANLPKIEIGAALTEVLEAGRAVPRSELIAAAARLLGYDLKVTGSRKALVARVDGEIVALTKSKDIVDRNGLLALPAAPGGEVLQEPRTPAGSPDDAPPTGDLPREAEQDLTGVAGADVRALHAPEPPGSDGPKRAAA